MRDEWRFDSISIEERTGVLTSIAKSLDHRELLSVIQRNLQRIRKRMQRGASNKKDVTRLLSRLAKLPQFATADRAELISTAKRFFLRHSGNIADFEAYHQFLRAHSRVFTEQERLHAKRKFERLVEERYYDDDPDYLREYASKLESLSAVFDVDVTGKVTRLEDIATDRERDAKSKEDLDVSKPDDREECSNTEIASMFEIFA